MRACMRRKEPRMISVAVAEKDLDLRDTAPAERIPRALAAFKEVAGASES